MNLLQSVRPIVVVMAIVSQGNVVAQSEDNLVHGEYIMRAAGCLHCHTAEEGDTLAGGRALETPFGTAWGEIAATIFVGVIPIFIFALLVQKWMIRGLSFGAIK